MMGEETAGGVVIEEKSGIWRVGERVKEGGRGRGSGRWTRARTGAERTSAGREPAAAVAAEGSEDT